MKYARVAGAACEGLIGGGDVALIDSRRPLAFSVTPFLQFPLEIFSRNSWIDIWVDAIPHLPVYNIRFDRTLISEQPPTLFPPININHFLNVAQLL